MNKQRSIYWRFAVLFLVIFSAESTAIDIDAKNNNELYIQHKIESKVFGRSDEYSKFYYEWEEMRRNKLRRRKRSEQFENCRAQAREEQLDVLYWVCSTINRKGFVIGASTNDLNGLTKCVIDINKDSRFPSHNYLLGDATVCVGHRFAP